VVAVQIHLRLVSFRVVSNFGVVFLPVFVVRNGSVHFTFDLTHESVMCELRLVWQQLGAIATPCVPVCLLVSEHAEMGVNNEVDHLIGGRAIETLTEPVNRQISGCHGIEEEVLQVLQVLVREEVVCHVTIISTGSDALGSMVDTLPTGRAADLGIINPLTNEGSSSLPLPSILCLYKCPSLCPTYQTTMPSYL
jgi:hypothetical protein